MSNIDRERWTERFKQKYPLESSLGLEIMSRFGDIAQDVYSDTRIPPRRIEFIIGEHGESKKPALMIPELDGMLFIAAIARTAIDHVLSVVDNTGKLDSALAGRARKRATKLAETKTTVSKCLNCGHGNKYYENYCTSCGEQLRG